MMRKGITAKQTIKAIRIKMNDQLGNVIIIDSDSSSDSSSVSSSSTTAKKRPIRKLRLERLAPTSMTANDILMRRNKAPGFRGNIIFYE